MKTPTVDYYKQLLRLVAEELNVEKVTCGKLIYNFEADTLELKGYK